MGCATETRSVFYVQSLGFTYNHDVVHGLTLFLFAKFQILHRKLCARNVFLCGTNGRAVKVGGFGIADFAPPNEEVDATRWTAQESLRSQSQLHYASKCDVWSFGCTMWEIATLGKTCAVNSCCWLSNCLNGFYQVARSSYTRVLLDRDLKSSSRNVRITFPSLHSMPTCLLSACLDKFEHL